MSLLEKGLRRNIRRGGAALAASAIVLAGAGCADDPAVTVVELTPCNLDLQPKTTNVRIKEGDSVDIGDYTLIKGNNSGGFDIRSKSGGESDLSDFLMEGGSFFIDKRTGNTIQIKGEKDWNWFRSYTKLRIEANCDQ